MDDLPNNEEIKNRTRYKGTRMHQGKGHWHVRIRSTVIECQNCGAKIPKYMKPESCPKCGAN